MPAFSIEPGGCGNTIVAAGRPYNILFSINQTYGSIDQAIAFIISKPLFLIIHYGFIVNSQKPTTIRFIFTLKNQVFIGSPSSTCIIKMIYAILPGNKPDTIIRALKQNYTVGCGHRDIRETVFYPFTVVIDKQFTRVCAKPERTIRSFYHVCMRQFIVKCIGCVMWYWI